MSETKPYKVTMNGTETTLLLDEDDAKMWGVFEQEADDEPANLDDQEVVDAAAAALNEAAEKAAEEQRVADDAAAAKLTADLTAAVNEKQAPAPADKSRRAPNKGTAKS